MKPPKSCLARGCPELVYDGSYCQKHRPKKKPSPSTAACQNPFHRRRREALVRQGPPWTCSICGQLVLNADDLDAHHVWAIGAGGPHGGPVAPAHRSCNRRLGARTA